MAVQGAGGTTGQLPASLNRLRSIFAVAQHILRRQPLQQQQQQQQQQPAGGGGGGYGSNGNNVVATEQQQQQQQQESSWEPRDFAVRAAIEGALGGQYSRLYSINLSVVDEVRALEGEHVPGIYGDFDPFMPVLTAIENERVSAGQKILQLPRDTAACVRACVRACAWAARVSLFVSIVVVRARSAAPCPAVLSVL